MCSVQYIRISECIRLPLSTWKSVHFHAVINASMSFPACVFIHHDHITYLTTPSTFAASASRWQLKNQNFSISVVIAFHYIHRLRLSFFVIWLILLFFILALVLNILLDLSVCVCVFHSHHHLPFDSRSSLSYSPPNSFVFPPFLSSSQSSHEKTYW